MVAITSMVEIKKILQQAATMPAVPILADFVGNHILSAKIRFPLLELAAKGLFDLVEEHSQVSFLNAIIRKKTIGGNVLAGIILQKRLGMHFEESLKKAEEYIMGGNEWYVCDIIGERVYGHALLTMPDNTLPVLTVLAKHDNKWMVRCIGVAAHYAVKKGLKKVYVDEVFRMLLSLGTTTDFHTKKGIGWAAKTIAKFHPDIIDKYREAIDSNEVKQWFRSKVKTGLSRTGKYAGRFTG